MLRLILGIIAVGILQVGMIVFTMFDGPQEVSVASVADEMRQIRPIADTPDLPPVVSEKDRDERSFSRTAARRDSAPLGPNASAQSTRTKRGSAPPKFEQPQQKRADDFKTVIISYSGSSASVDCDRPEPAKPRSRSLTARAGTIAKKPWELIKNVASKLN